jgi:hypothetical protein
MKTAFALLAILATFCGDMPADRGSVPINYRVGWRASQDDLRITNISVSATDHSLNMMNSRTTATVQIEGTLHEDRIGWKPVIKELQVSQRVVPAQSPTEHAVEVELTPVVELVEDKSYTPRTSAFAVRSRLHLEMIGWGYNQFTFRADSLTKSVTLAQRK